MSGEVSRTGGAQERPERRITRLRAAILDAGALPGRLATGVAAAASMLAVLLSSRALGVVAIALAGLILAHTLYALFRGLLRAVLIPLAPLTALVRRAALFVARPFASAGRWIHAHADRARERMTDALLALDRRLGDPVASSAQRVPARLRGLLLCVPRFNAWLAVVIATLLGLALMIYLVSGWLGYALAGRKTPVAAEWLYAGAFVTATIAVLVLAFWIRALGRLVFLSRWRRRSCTTVAVLAVLVGVALLSTPEVPGELDGGGARAKLEGGRSSDVLVVVDPADPAGRELAEYVRGSLPTLAAPRADALPFDVASGVVTPVDPALEESLDPWTVVEPPTANRRHFLDSVAAVAPRDGGRATARYAALLASLRDPDHLQWHRGARRTVALVLAELPRERELDGAGASWPEVVSAYRADRASEQRVRLVVFTQERRPERIRPWRSWLREMGARLVTYRAADATLLADLEDAATGTAVSAVGGLARSYSPHLRFDGEEQFFPVDVDDLLAKGEHEVCDHVRLYDDCQPLDDYKDMLGALDEYIDFEGGARLGRDLVDHDVRLGVRPAMYVDAVERGDRLYLAYWWFLRYNVSPWRPERNCLPGFTFAETTCFDHEGDFEGVTVTLRAKGSRDVPDPYAPERWRPESVSFASHSNVTRWDWAQVEAAGATHPVVYVAQGSHAAYPTRCTFSCTQRLAGPGLPEGDFDGAIDWRHNDTACCRTLPVTPDHRGALWNAFPGRWGKAVCTAFLKVCSQSDGPRSPSAQRRFEFPEGRTFASQAAVLARFRARYGTEGAQ